MDSRCCIFKLTSRRCNFKLDSRRCNFKLDSRRCNFKLDSRCCNFKFESRGCNFKLASRLCNFKLDSRRCNFKWPSIYREVSLINNNILNLFNNMKSEVVFLAWKWLNSVHLSIVSGAKNAKITFVEKPKMNIFRFQEQKYGYIIIYCILDQTKLFREPLWVGHVSLFKEEHLKLRPFSWRKTYFDFKFLS